MKACQLRDLLSVVPGDYDVMIGNNPVNRVNVDYKFGYLFLKTEETENEEVEEDE